MQFQKLFVLLPQKFPRAGGGGGSGGAFEDQKIKKKIKKKKKKGVHLQFPEWWVFSGGAIGTLHFYPSPLMECYPIAGSHPPPPQH